MVPDQTPPDEELKKYLYRTAQGLDEVYGIMQECNAGEETRND